MELNFGVYSAYKSVYMAFIEECEKIGWVWVESFTPKEKVNSYLNKDRMFGGCIFLSNQFGAKFHEPAMSFSSSNMELINLDTNFAGAVEKASKYYDKIIEAKFKNRYTVKNLSVGSGTSYDAEIDTNGVTVGCQLVTFEKFDELNERVAEFRKNN